MHTRPTNGGGSTVDNHWTRHADLLAPAYVRAAGRLRFELVTRALVAAIGPEPVRVLDVGGGFGEQAIRLARLGHEVTVLDCDATMLTFARDRADGERREVAERITFVLGSGAEAMTLVGTERFELTCCHSVLLYEEDPGPLLDAVVGSTRDGGLLSIISTNARARAMRSGLQQRWRQAAETIRAGTQVDDRCLPTAEHDLETVERLLAVRGAVTVGWHGLGVFTDHLETVLDPGEWNDVVACEWLAGTTDPYRRVARTYHLLSRVDRRPTTRD